jgi:NADH-quinone oxidoreductase subunit G
VAAPSAWLAELAGIAAAVAEARGVACRKRSRCEGSPTTRTAGCARRSVRAKAPRAARQRRGPHPEFAPIHAAAQWIADTTGATLGFLTEAANTVGAHLVGALPGEGGLNAREVFEQPRKAYVLLNVEPEFDTANPRRHSPR